MENEWKKIRTLIKILTIHRSELKELKLKDWCQNINTLEPRNISKIEISSFHVLLLVWNFFPCWWLPV